MEEPNRQHLPKKLRNASAEEIAAYRSQVGRKAVNNAEAVRQHFWERMEREGKLAEFEARIEQLRQEGKSRRQAVYAAMREFGFKNADDERYRHRQHLTGGRLSRAGLLVSHYTKKRKKRMRQTPLLEEFSKLPDNAPNKVELAWVRSHPLMMQAQLARLEATDDCPADPIKPKVEDMVSPANGKCPSKSAWTTLLAWLQDPKEFQKQLLPEQRKASDSTGGKDGEEGNNAVTDESLDDVRKMLNAVVTDG